MEKIKIFIADDTEETRNVIKKILNLEKDVFQLVGEAANGEEVLREIKKNMPDIILMDINMPVMNGLEATEQITALYPQVIVIIMSVQAESEYLKKAMFNGAKEYIIKPFNYDMLISTIRNTYDKYKERAKKLESIESKAPDGRIITCYSAKGGVGKSVLSLNTAILMGKSFNKKTLLVDMDFQYGDISVLVNQYDCLNFLNAIEDDQLTSFESLRKYIHSYDKNIDILFAPARPESAEYVTKSSVEALLKQVINKYEVIIVDTGVNFNDSTLYILDKSDFILFVTTMEITALKNTKLGLGVMNTLGYDKKKVKLIVNRFNTGFGISKSEIEEVFKDQLLAMVPDEEKLVATSVNKGEPFCDSAMGMKSKIKKAMEDYCKELLK